MKNHNFKFKTKDDNPVKNPAAFKKVVIFSAMGILIALTFIGLPKLKMFFGESDKENKNSSEILADVPVVKTSSDYKAYDVALKEVEKWQADAKLSLIDTNISPVSDSSKLWKFTFSSPNSQKGLLVEVAGKRVVNTEEVAYVSAGSELPSGAISSEEAAEKVSLISGYEDAEILGAEAVFGEGDQTWYWGVKTSKGTVSVEAGK